jgi:AsmA protein
VKSLIGIGVALVLLIGTILLLPFLIDLNKYQDQYKPSIEGALNRKIQLQDIRLTIWPRLGARVGGFAVLDDPSFSSGPVASLTSLDIGVKLWPLLSGRIEIEEIALRDPVITVIKNKSGVTNVSTIGPKTPTGSPPPKESGTPPEPGGDPLQALALLAVDRVSIEDGRLTYRDLSTPPATEYRVQNLELLLKAVHLGETPTLHFGATVEPYHLPVRLDGSFGSIVQAVELKQHDLTLGLGKIALALKGALVGGKLDATLTAPSISTADLPIALPLTKPMHIKDLRVVAKASYPFKAGASALELAEITDLGLAVVMGNSALNVRGTVLGGHAKVRLTAPSVNTSDLPVDTGLKKPVEVKNLEVNADLKGQEARISNLSFRLFNGEAKRMVT